MLLLLSYTVASVALWGLFWLSGVGPGSRLPAAVLRRAPILTPVVLGLGVWMPVLFLLACLQLLRPLPVLTVAVATAAWGISSLRRWRQRGVSPMRPPRKRAAGERAATWILASAVGVVLAVLMLEALHPSVSWDASAYHLTLPKLYLEHGGFFRVPFNVYSNWPLGVELLFALAMVIRDYVLAKTLHFGFAVATLAVVYRLAARRTSPWVGLLAAALVLFNPVVLFEARIAYVDLALAFFAVAALFFLHGTLDDEHEDHARERRTGLLLSGLCCGLAAAVKLNGFFVAGSLAAVLLVARRRSLRRAVLQELPLLVLPSVLGLLPWLAKSAVLTGNPVYPLLYTFFDGPEWSAELGLEHAAWQSSIGMGRSLTDYLLLPWRVILHGGLGYDRFDGKIHQAWIVFLPAAAAALPTSGVVRRALGAAGLLFLLWGLTSQQMRLLLPVLPLVAVAAAIGSRRLGCRLPSPVLKGAARPALAVLVSALLLSSAWPYLRRSPRLFLTLTAHGQELRQVVVPPAVRFVNDALPPDARLLLLNSNQGFFLDRPYIADSFFEASQVAALLAPSPTPEDAVSTLRELGITHILLDRRSRGIVYPPVVDQLLEDRDLVRPLYRSPPDGRFVVLALRSSPGTA